MADSPDVFQETLMCSGDILYIPCFFFHTFRYLRASVSLTYWVEKRYGMKPVMTAAEEAN